MTRGMLLCLVVVLFHWRLVFTGGEYTWLEAPGVFERVFPLMQFQAGELHKWRLPILDPYSPGGSQPLIGFAAGVTPVWYLPHTLLLALPLNHGWLHQKPLHWYFVLTQCAMAVAMSVFARRRLFLSQPASFVAGLAYALGVWSALGPDPQVLHAAIWVPAIFAARPGWRRALLLGVVWLPGGLYIPLAVALALAVADFRQSRRDVALGLAVGAIVIVPGLAFGPLPMPPLANLSAGIVLPVLGIFGWYIGVRRPQVRSILLPSAVAGLLHPVLLIFSLSGAMVIVLDDSGTIRPVARRWANLVASVAGLVVAWALLPWIRFDQLAALESLALPCLIAGGAALLLWTRPEPRRAILFAAMLVLADNARPRQAHRMLSRYDAARPRQLQSLASALPQVAYLKQFAHDRQRIWVDPAEVPYAFGPWWGVETAEGAEASYRISVRAAAGFERVLYSGDGGWKVFAANRPAASGGCEATQTAGVLYPNHRTFTTAASCAWRFDGHLGSGQGWRVTLDGKSVEYPQEGLPVPAGDHKIEMRFAPIPLIAGALVTGIGLLCTFLLARGRPFKL